VLHTHRVCYTVKLLDVQRMLHLSKYDMQTMSHGWWLLCCMTALCVIFISKKTYATCYSYWAMSKYLYV